MTDRDRLVELIIKADTECANTKQCDKCDQYGKGKDCINYHIADYLISKGVIVAPMPMAEWLRNELTEYVKERCYEEL